MQPRLRERLTWIGGPFTFRNRIFRRQIFGLEIDSFRDREGSFFPLPYF
jgi:hypothetical protein